jgi:hypothetical protein
MLIALKFIEDHVSTGDFWIAFAALSVLVIGASIYFRPPPHRADVEQGLQWLCPRLDRLPQLRKSAYDWGLVVIAAAALVAWAWGLGSFMHWFTAAAIVTPTVIN